jgi:hypothetical protein
MITFTIENETNNITAHATAQEAEAVPNAERFRNEAGLAKLAANWPVARLVEIYNSLPGVSPVKKFTDRKTAAGRIWKAIQGLRQSLPDQAEAHASVDAQPDATATPVAPETADVAPTKAPSDRKTTRREKAPKAATQAKGARDGSKTAQVVAMLAEAHGPRLRGRRDEEGRIHRRVLQIRQGRADLPHQLVASTAHLARARPDAWLAGVKEHKPPWHSRSRSTGTTCHRAPIQGR